MSAQNNKGIVYILTNSAMPGLVKIGMTTRESISQYIGFCRYNIEIHN
ncbi:GIY-YIG nuclease family protein [Bacteroides ihuae]